jgi:hypothetical protein
MKTDTALWQIITQMPENLKTELLHYAEYLMEKHSPTVKEDELPPKKRRSGILKGTFVLPLPDDFDEPLEDGQNNME